MDAHLLTEGMLVPDARRDPRLYSHTGGPWTTNLSFPFFFAEVN